MVLLGFTAMCTFSRASLVLMFLPWQAIVFTSLHWEVLVLSMYTSTAHVVLWCTALGVCQKNLDVASLPKLWLIASASQNFMQDTFFHTIFTVLLLMVSIFWCLSCWGVYQCKVCLNTKFTRSFCPSWSSNTPQPNSSFHNISTSTTPVKLCYTMVQKQENKERHTWNLTHWCYITEKLGRHTDE